jgi:hypothetical protein
MTRLQSFLVLALGAVSPIGLAAQTASPVFTKAWPDDSNWRRYVVSPVTPIAHPVRIVSTAGQIKNASALLAPEKRDSATLTRSAGETGPTNIVLDYGIDVGGLPTWDVTAASGSPKLQASYSESLDYLTLDGDKGASHSADPHRHDAFIITKPGTITNAFTQGGERYEMISLTTPGTVSLRAVGVKIGFYHPGAAGYQGHFICSDEELNKIWYASAYTLQTNMLPPGSIAAPKIIANAPADVAPELLPTNTIPVVVDGAKRDRSVWSGDLAVQGPVIYYSTDATEYMRESLRLLGSYGSADGRVSTNLPSEWPLGHGPTAASEAKIFSANYALWWAKALADYYLYTGDKEFLKDEWPILTKELDWAASQVRSDGLFVTDAKNGHDWDYYDGPKVGAVTAYNALYYRVLFDSAALADDLGQKDQAQKYRAAATTLQQAIAAKLFNPQTGVFDISDVERGTIAQDANVFALAFGLAPEDKAGSILAKLKENLWTKTGPKPFAAAKYKLYLSPYVTGFELLARLRADDAPNALALMSSLWGPMIAPGNSQTGAIWEAITPEGKPALGKTTSLAHGWGAMPATALSSLVLGIQPVTAGYATWRIQPHPGDLVWAEGRAPTPHGPIDVAWGRSSSSTQFNLRVSAPANTTGEIAIPTFGTRIAVYLNGRIVWNGDKATDSTAHRDQNYISLENLPGGTYQVVTIPAATSR